MNNNLALVVDDSTLARAVLKKLLVEQGLEVDTMASAEEALVYLYTQQPDVIFMDHTMPGMDGLLAVKAIKNNPKTAVIPIMMYTSKEGEMYVSQARALGAVGVLPKQLANTELKNVLDELKLLPGQTKTVHHTNKPAHKEMNEPPLKSYSSIQADNHKEQKPVKNKNSSENSLDEVQEAANTASVYQTRQALKTDLQEFFEHQTTKLHSDIETSTRQLSDIVLSGIEKDLSLKLDELFEQRMPKATIGFSYMNVATIFAIMSIPFIWLAYENQSLNKNLTAYSIENQILKESLALNNAKQKTEFETINPLASDSRNDKHFYNAIEWAINQNNSRPYGEPAFGDGALRLLSNLIPQLENAQFKGLIKLVSHRGQFCFNETAYDANPNLADERAPFVECIIPDERTVNNLSLADQQTIEFSNFLSSLNGDGNNRIQIEIDDKGAQVPVSAYPENGRTITAGTWNKIARKNNRLEVIIVPENEGMIVDL